MPTYGPWLDAVTIDHAQTSWAQADIRSAHIGPAGGSGASSASAVSTAITAARDALDPPSLTEGLDFTGGFGAATVINWIPGAADSFTVTGDRDDRGVYADAVSILTLLESAYSSALAAGAPPSAIDVELEDTEFDVQSVAVSIPMQEFGSTFDGGGVIATPMHVETFRRPASDAADFAGVGSEVSVDDRICTHDEDGTLGDVSAAPIEFTADAADLSPDGGFIVYPIADLTGSAGWTVDADAVFRASEIDGTGVAQKRFIIDGDPSVVYTFLGPRYRYVFQDPWPWHVVDSAANGGTVWRLGPDSNPDGGIARIVLPDGTVYVQSPAGAPLTMVDPALGAAFGEIGQLPFVLEDDSPSLWLAASNYYYGDVGLWLGGDFTDLTGYPASLPTGASELDFLVLSPGDDPGDVVFDTPYADYYIYDDEGPTSGFFQTGPTPAPDSHVWVLWYGPASNTAVDPDPPNAPAFYVPATLAADGEA